MISSDFELDDSQLVSEKELKELNKKPLKKYYKINEKVYKDVDYYMAIGKRSNGKTTKGLLKILQLHVSSGYKFNGAYVRRWQFDFKGNTPKSLWDNLINLGWIERETKGEYNSVVYKSERWTLVHYNKDGEIDKICDTPLCFGFNLNASEHYKSSAYPFIKLIVFDEFLTRDIYINDEFVVFQNLLSTIIRDRTDVKILMFANTVNKYCPYFNEMGLYRIKKQKQGTIDIYTYPNTDLKVAVEYCADNTVAKENSNKYFAFDNPKLKMITQGSWEISIYPHLPCKFTPSEVEYTFYIKFDSEVIECKIVNSITIGFPFIFCHYKTTPIKADDKERIVFDVEPNPNPLYRVDITRPMDDSGVIIWNFFRFYKVFYQSNEIGEIVNNYINYCKNLK